jgi:DNA-binding ferritin-like protein
MIKTSRELLEVASENGDVALESILGDIITNLEKKAWMVKTTLS